jgi:hypothetical protein
MNFPEKVKINIEVHFHGEGEQTGGLSAKLDSLISLVKTVIEKEKVMTLQLDELTAQVQAVEDADQASIKLLQGLSDIIASIKNDPAALQALSDRLKTSAEALTGAVNTYTPPS